MTLSGLRLVTLLLALALFGCNTEVVELLPDAMRDAAPEARPGDGPLKDAVDSASADAPATCVCRYIACRNNSECELEVGPASTCSGFICSGGAGSCTTTADCGASSLWVCAASPSSLTDCP